MAHRCSPFRRIDALHQYIDGGLPHLFDRLLDR
jgi:hypothetical protein